MSIISEETTEVYTNQFKFETQVQNSLKLQHPVQKFCNVCRSNTYVVEKYELQRLNTFQYFSYWLQNLKCCSEPKMIGKFHVTKFYCIFCGNNVL